MYLGELSSVDWHSHIKTFFFSFFLLKLCAAAVLSAIFINNQTEPHGVCNFLFISVSV